MFANKSNLTTTPDSVSTSAHPVLMMSTISKSYGPTKALTEVNLDIRQNEIRAVLGENGSGKSTLVKILSGVVSPDSGKFSVDGRDLRLRSPRDAKSFGIETVFQETLAAPEMSVLDNIFMGTDGLFSFKYRTTDQRRLANGLFEKLHCAIGLDRTLGSLRLPERQLVTIARSLVRDWKLLILDESTSALDIQVRDGLFAYLRKERPPGSSVIFITHRMDEIATLADSVTLLQSGKTMATLQISDASTDKLVSIISATRDHKIEDASKDRADPQVVRVGKSYRASDIVLRENSRPITSDFPPGRILGFSGLDGHGQAEFLSVIAGVTKPLAGKVEHQTDAGWKQINSLKQGFKHGISYVPRDRKNDGLFLGLSILDNFSIPTLWRYSNFGFVQRRRLKDAATRDLQVFKTRYSDLNAPVGRLSGGNQQKVLLARWLAAKPKLLVLDDPLRGVDAATKRDIHQVFRELAGSGMTLLLLSTEIEELVSLCDQVSVFREGQVSATLNDAEINRDAIVAAMFGEYRPTRRNLK